MKKISASLTALILLGLPLAASAHEHNNYKIGDSYYQFVVGSLNEPIVVDDKSGLDLTVNKCFNSSCMAKMSADGDMDGPAGTPVTGLESTLKVEMIAGDQRADFDLSAQYGKPGSYKTTFFPTVATSFSYHITGTIDNTPVDLTFTCLPEGAAKAADDTTAVKLSDSVTRTLHAGSFGCAKAKADLGFPELSASTNDLSSTANSAKSASTVGIALGVVGVALGVMSLARRKN